MNSEKLGEGGAGKLDKKVEEGRGTKWTTILKQIINPWFCESSCRLGIY